MLTQYTVFNFGWKCVFLCVGWHAFANLAGNFSTIQHNNAVLHCSHLTHISMFSSNFRGNIDQATCVELDHVPWYLMIPIGKFHSTIVEMIWFWEIPKEKRATILGTNIRFISKCVRCERKAGKIYINFYLILSLLISRYIYISIFVKGGAQSMVTNW